MTTFLVVDIETSGEAPPAVVVELGWTSLEGELEGSMLFGLPPGVKMPPEVRAVHHIDPASLEGLGVFDANHWDVGVLLTDVDYVVAHNSAFEAQWLHFPVPWICTYKCAVRAWPEAPKHTNQALKYWLGIEDRADHHPPHRALPDAKVTALILARLLQNHSPEQLAEWTRLPRLVLHMPFGKHRGLLLSELDRGYLEWVAGPGCQAADYDLRHACREQLEKKP